MSSRSPEIVIAGAGPMAEEHLRALLAVRVPRESILVVGRGRERAVRVGHGHGVATRWGGIESLQNVPPLAIVAVAETELAGAVRHLLGRGARAVLVEKPGALSVHGLDGIAGDAVFVGYNRRFLPSTRRARELVADDGGAVATVFDFTEIEERVLSDARRRDLPRIVLERWGIANSLHVIDLAFHLGGEPSRLSAHRTGSLPWHPAGAVFAGSGELVSGGLFSYQATWSGVGRWSVELTTRKRKLVLRPLETLTQQLHGLQAPESLEIVPEPDGVKPGLAGQARAFLDAARDGRVDPALCTLAEARARLRLAAEMFGYD